MSLSTLAMRPTRFCPQTCMNSIAPDMKIGPCAVHRKPMSGLPRIGRNEQPRTMFLSHGLPVRLNKTSRTWRVERDAVVHMMADGSDNGDPPRVPDMNGRWTAICVR